MMGKLVDSLLACSHFVGVLCLCTNVQTVSNEGSANETRQLYTMSQAKKYNDRYIAAVVEYCGALDAGVNSKKEQSQAESVIYGDAQDRQRGEHKARSTKLQLRSRRKGDWVKRSVHPLIGLFAMQSHVHAPAILSTQTSV